MRRTASLVRTATATRIVATAVAGALVVGLAAVSASYDQATDLAPVSATGNPVTPGDFTGYGFDQCNTVSEAAMRAWRRSSPFGAVGIYISGDSRACKTQANLTPTWVTNQLADGWRLLPITLGPQASCSTRFPRYGSRIDPTINPSPTGGYAAAQAQGRAEAQEAVAVAQRLGIVARSTLFYDLEAFSLTHSTACNTSALWFMHAWTTELHRLGYASGYYSSAATGIKLLDDERVRSGGSRITLPDQLWIADWDGTANTSSRWVRSDGWQPASRVKQYRGDHDRTYGGVRINIDANYMTLRTPTLPGAAAPVPPVAPPVAPPASGPRATGRDLIDPRCTPATINRATYRRTGPTRTEGLVALQCLLKQQRHYPYEVTGRWNTETTAALNGFQRSVAHPERGWASRSDWVSLLVRGQGGTWGASASSADLTRLQRALNAAGRGGVPVTGTWTTTTAQAAAAYQRKVRARTPAATWRALSTGRW